MKITNNATLYSIELSTHDLEAFNVILSYASLNFKLSSDVCKLATAIVETEPFTYVWSSKYARDLA